MSTPPEDMPKGKLRAALVLPYVLGRASTGTEQIGLQVRLLDAPWAGRVLPFYASFTPDAFPMTYKALKAFGWRGEQVTTLKQDLRDGVEVVVTVEPEEYDGKWRPRVRFVDPPQSIRMHTVYTKEQRATLGFDIQKMLDDKLHERERRVDRDPATPDVVGGPSDDIPF